MQKPGWKKEVEHSDGYKYKIAFDAILEFIHLMPDDAFQKLDKMNYTTEDYTLKQFQWWVAKKIDEGDYHDNL